jgi:hypothetical protein
MALDIISPQSFSFFSVVEETKGKSEAKDNNLRVEETERLVKPRLRERVNAGA